MIKTILFLTALGVVQGVLRLTQPHPDCPFGVHRLLPHEYDCTKFYYCEWGERFIVPTNCAPGTEFSFSLQVCTFPVFSGCELTGSSTTDPTTVSTSTVPSTTTTTSTSTVPSTTTTSISTSTTPSTTTPISTSTVPSTTTSVSTSTTPFTTTSTSTTSSTTPGDTEDEEDSSEDPDDIDLLPNGCPANVDISISLPHQYYCNKSYQCVFGQKSNGKCPEGSDFNYGVKVGVAAKKSLKKKFVKILICVTC